MKKIWYKTTLFEYDGPQIFEARDRIGGHYLGVAVVPKNQKDQFLVVGAEPAKLRKFRNGVIDLRSLIIDSSADEWYLTESNTEESTFEIELQAGSLQDHDFLPDEGFFLNDYSSSENTVFEAQKRNNLILEFVVEPPESSLRHRIRVSTLGRILQNFQSLIDHALKTHCRDSEISKGNSKSDRIQMDVVIPASAGSSKVLLEFSASPDIFDSRTELASALQKIDDLFMKSTNPQNNLFDVFGNHNRLTKSYLKLLRLLEKSDTGFGYTWAEPNFVEPKGCGLSLEQVDEILEILENEEILSESEVEFIGEFERVNRNAKKWGLLTDNGVVVGVVGKDGPTLDGLEVGRRYKFFCKEERGEFGVAATKNILNDFESL